MSNDTPRFLSSEITPKEKFLNRRNLIFGGMAAAGLGYEAWKRLPPFGEPNVAYASTKLPAQPGPFSATSLTPTPRAKATSYNNFWEFGTDKRDPQMHAHTLQTRPWTVSLEGLCANKKTIDVDSLMRYRPLQERIYRFRCVENWSMVIPWDGYPLADLIEFAKPLPTAKYVEFHSFFDRRQMPEATSLPFPYIEGLRMDEAMHPLTLLTFGSYGETLENQQGAPVRIIVPWKYGFKSPKSIVKIRFVADQPNTTWNDGNPEAYGFYYVKGKPTSKKRKRGVKEEKPKKKKKIRIKLRIPTREPCCMCPNDNPWESLLPTDSGKKAHRSCALYTPETFVVKGADGMEKVCGVTTIDRARLDLKCNFCRSKRGACFQCSSKKCTRAFHATCALAAGVLIDAGLVPTFGEDGTEYYEEGYDFRCKYHRPKMPKNLNIESLEKSSRINNYAKEVKHNDVIQAQLVGGEVFAGLVVENRPSEMSLIVDVLPEGDRVEVEYKWLCLLDPDDSQRQKPTSNAIAMPEGLNRKELSMSNRQDGVPDQGQPFQENPDFKWHDFYNMDMPPPGYASSKIQAPSKLNIKFDSPDQLYFYLGDQSTEAKCFFTDKAGTSEVAAKANFLERVQPPKTISQHQGTRPTMPLPPWKPAVPMQRQNQFSATPAASTPNEKPKPYIYKPRDQMQPKNYLVDAQSLANQRSFLADSSNGRGMPQSGEQSRAQHNYQGADMSTSPAPPKAFPTDQYYSMRMLPAAVPGGYSTFTQAVRRESQGQQTMQRPGSQLSAYAPAYQPVHHQQTEFKQHQDSAQFAGSPPPPALMYLQGASGSRPTSSANSYQSPYAAPLTPATTHSTASAHKTADGSSTDQAYLSNLQKYPYLLRSYCKKPKVYESPYPLGGGFSAAYQVHDPTPPTNQRPHSYHTPQGSVSGSEDRRGSHGWAPPSQIWDKAGLRHQASPPPQHPQYSPPSRQMPGPTYSTPSEFRQQIQAMPSTASREGAQARALRDQQGYHTYHQYHRNSFGQAYDTARVWQSPRAPTPSPLSDPNTPGQAPTAQMSWGSLPRTEAAPVPQRNIMPKPAPAPGPDSGCGPAFSPQMGGVSGNTGNETWRYG